MIRKNMKRAQRRHEYQTRKRATRLRFAWWDGLNESHICQLTNTTIWKNFPKIYGRPPKPAMVRADLNMKEQLKEERLQEAA